MTDWDVRDKVEPSSSTQTTRSVKHLTCCVSARLLPRKTGTSKDMTGQSSASVSNKHVLTWKSLPKARV